MTAFAPGGEHMVREEIPAPADPSAGPPSLELTPPTAHRALRTAPTSPANQRLEQMRLLLAVQSPTPAQLRQAIDLLLAAHRADPEHLQLPAARGALLRTLSAQLVAAIEDGDDVHAQALSRLLPRIRKALPRPRAPLDALNSAIYDAVSARLDATLDAAVAQRSFDTARLAGLPPEQLMPLRSRLRALLPPPGWTSVRLNGHLLHISDTPVSRAAWARFAQATTRPPTLCRERASMLRLVAPRTWSRPGFAQTGNDPVVCVSWQDALDYAAWAGQRDARRYRLISLDEAAALPTAEDARTGGRALAEWRNDCDTNCARRMVSGRSWRSRQDLRALPAERGYPDVGFRLAIDPQLAPRQ